MKKERIKDTIKEKKKMYEKQEMDMCKQYQIKLLEKKMEKAGKRTILKRYYQKMIDAITEM